MPSEVAPYNSIQVPSLSICLMNRTSSELFSFSFHSNLSCQFSSPYHTTSQRVMYRPFPCPPPTTMTFQLRYRLTIGTGKPDSFISFESAHSFKFSNPSFSNLSWMILDTVFLFKDTVSFMVFSV